MKRMTLSIYAASLLAMTAVVIGSAGAGQSQSASPRAGKADRATVEQLISDWSGRSRLGAQQMLDKYGPPQEATTEQLIWHGAGPFKRINVTKAEHPHDFPLPHMDYMEHTVDFLVPAEKASALASYDGSFTFDRTRGEMSSRCDLEGHNILTLNLAHDIMTGKRDTEEARKAYGQIVVEDALGKHPSYVEALQFELPKKAAYSDIPTIPGAPKRAAEVKGEDKKSGDAEVLAFVAAIDLNEIVAATQTSKEKVGTQVSAYATKLHQEHGKNLQETLKLGQNIDVTPVVTPAVSQLRAKGANTLAGIVPLDGEQYGKAYLEAMVKSHQKAQDMIDDRLLKEADNEKVKKHLKDTRDSITEHLDQAKKLQASMSQ